MPKVKTGGITKMFEYNKGGVDKAKSFAKKTGGKMEMMHKGKKGGKK
jgi:hypothetical protein